MKKILLGLGLLGAIALSRPAPAHADFSLSIGLPGFGIFVHDPYPPPLVYGPPVVYAPPAYYPPPPAYYYRPYPVYYRGYRGHGHHRGWSGRARHWR